MKKKITNRQSYLNQNEVDTLDKDKIEAKQEIKRLIEVSSILKGRYYVKDGITSFTSAKAF